MPAPTRRRLIVAIIVAVIFAVAFLGYNSWRNRLPSSSSIEYQRMVSAFYSGVLAMNVSDDEHAATSLLSATQIVPQEPAAWADLGLFEMRKGNFTQARQALDKAHGLAPNNSKIEALLGLLASSQGQSADAMTHLQRAVTLDPANVRARFALIQALQQSGGDASEAQRQLAQIHQALPSNLFADLQLASVMAKADDLAQVRALVGQAAALSAAWPADAQQQLAALQKTVAGSDARAAVTQITFLSNVLQAVPQYQRDRDAVRGDLTIVGTPLENFVSLPSPPATPAAPDMGLAYTPEPLTPQAGAGPWTIARRAWLSPQTQATLLANAAQVQVVPDSGPAQTLPFPGAGTTPTPNGILALDWNNDFSVDILLAGAGGLRFFQQGAGGTFTDVSTRTKLPAAILNGAYIGAWATDIDSDGDLDVILGVKSGPPTVLRNNGDGTWTPIQPFPGPTRGVRAFAWADLDGDSASDAALIDGTGKLFVFENRRNGVFIPWPLPTSIGKAVAITSADVDRDGQLDLVVLGADGVIHRLTRQGDGWTTAELAQWPAPPTDGTALISFADLDNNGTLDLIATGASGTGIWLSDAQGKFLSPAAKIDAHGVSPDGADKAGGPDLIGLSPSGQPARFASHGTKHYAWQQVRLRSALAGDQRNNAYGIGGNIEMRAGLLYQKQIVTQPVTQFGLGTYPQADYIRILWPNGSPQGEFSLKADQIAEAPERLKGSCPWLFADDGHGMKFVTDLIWRSPLGLRINAQNTAGVAMTRDRVRIAGNQLAPTDGFYNLNITAELWETHFFDYVRLLAVDHPAGTGAYVDERFAIPPPPLTIHLLTPPQAVTRAIDDRGLDVTDIVKSRDGRYLDTFGRGDYQGITRDHYVEMDLTNTPATSRRLYLVAQGWIHPTDSSINLALSQGHHAPPSGLSLETLDAQGHWATAKKNLGFPEGKNKTVLLDLTGVFKSGAPRRLRLRTNLEIYWDFLGTATELPSAPMHVHPIAPSVADLHYRGYSVTHQANTSSPELPDYSHLMGTGQYWIDLIGYCTRYGDVRPLLSQVDDRYVIMNAGDEMTLRFPALAPPPTGWTRDYVLEADGWEKDGDLNTAFSKTVLPLPSHDRPDYSTPPGRLQDDPVYKRHQQDWQTYQTRYITPRAFQNAPLGGTEHDGH